MTVNTKTVAGRRKLRYESLDDLLADAEKCAAGDTKQLGNWSPGQIFKHLAGAMESSIDGFDKLFPLPMRMALNVLMKKKFLNQAIPAGFKAPKNSQPAKTSNEEGLTLLRNAIERQKREPKRAMHPGFGKFTREEWEKFHLRHAEMHMSFLVPQSEA